MKKFFIILIVTALQQFFVSAQDLIITNSGDSINCKITEIKGDFLRFAFVNDGEAQNSLIPVGQVKRYQYNYYNNFELQPFQIVGYKPEFSHWRLAANIGLGYRTAPFQDGLSAAEKEYLKKLRRGLNISLDATYFFREMFGVGLKYDLFKTSTSSLGFEEVMSINFFGPVFSMRFFNQSKTNCWYFNYGFGYMGFTDKVESMNVSAKGNTAGIVTDVGYDIALSQKCSLGFQLSLLAGVLTELEETQNGYTQTIKLKKEEHEGLGRINFTIGLRFNL